MYVWFGCAFLPKEAAEATTKQHHRHTGSLKLAMKLSKMWEAANVAVKTQHVTMSHYNVILQKGISL